MLKRNKILIAITPVLLVLLSLVALPVIYSVSTLLSTTNRTDANILLIEGWLPSYAIDMAHQEFKKNAYDHVITTGIRTSKYGIGNPSGMKSTSDDYRSHAESARNELILKGLDPALITAIPGLKVRLNRTLSGALAFRDWLKTSEIEVKGINIVTMGTHARRTQMTYNKVLDKKYTIGIISLPDYQEKRSGKYKVIKILRESLGLVYYWFILIPY